MKLKIVILQLFIAGFFSPGCNDSNSPVQEEQSTENINADDSEFSQTHGKDTSASPTSNGSHNSDSESAKGSTKENDTSQKNDSESGNDKGSHGQQGKESENGTDATADTDTQMDSETAHPLITDTNTSSGNPEDTEQHIDSSTDSNPLECQYTCRSENWCDNKDGIVHDELSCKEATQVCCEMENDTDTRGGGEEPDTNDSVCIFECHSKIWCASNSATVYENLTCSGKQVCCAIEE